MLEELRPDKLIPSPDEAPDRWELGTLPFESLAGVTAAAEYMLDVGYDAIRAHEDALMATRARRASRAIDGVTLYGDPPDRVPTLMFNVAGHDVDRGRRPRWPRARSRSGTATTTPGSSSASSASIPTARSAPGFVHYNDASDAERLVEAVRAVAAARRPRAVAAAAGGEPPA